MKMVRVEWRDHVIPHPIKLTTMVQNCARVSFWLGLKRLSPVPSATPIQTEDVRVDGGGGVLHIAEGGGPGRGGRKDQTGGHGRGQQRVDHAILFHRCLSPNV